MSDTKSYPIDFGFDKLLDELKRMISEAEAAQKEAEKDNQEEKTSEKK